MSNMDNLTGIQFCKYCNKLMEKNVLDKKLFFKCTACNKNYPTTDNGTLLSEEDYTGACNTNNIAIQNAKYEEINQIINKKCPYCDSNYASVFRTGQEQEIKSVSFDVSIIPDIKTIYTCCKCKRQWIAK